MSVTDQCDQLILAIGSKNNDKVSELVENMDVGEINNTSPLRNSALETACGSFNDEALDTLLAKSGIDVNVKNTHGHTLLHMAATFNNSYTVSKIVASPGADVNVQSPLGRTPLHDACLENNPQILTQLLTCPEIQVNIRDWSGHTPIMTSALLCHKEVLELLLDDPSGDIEVKDKGGRGLEAFVGNGCGDDGKRAECLEMINIERMKRKNRQVKQDGSMAGGAEKANDDDSQMDGAQKLENTEEGNPANSGSSADLNVVDYDSLCWNCSKTEVKLEKCDGCQKARYCSKECWEKDSSAHGRWCRKHCWGCETTAVKEKKMYQCGGCQKAKYCKKECSVRDWNNHQYYCLQQKEKGRIGKE